MLSSSGLPEQPVIGAAAPCSLGEQREGREDQERAGDDEGVEHCNCFFTQNLAGIT